MIPSLQPDRSRKYLQNCRNNAKWIDFVLLRHFTERTFSLWCEAQRKDSAGKWQNLGKYWMVTVTLENSHFCLNFKSPKFRLVCKTFLPQSNIDFRLTVPVSRKYINTSKPSICQVWRYLFIIKESICPIEGACLQNL